MSPKEIAEKILKSRDEVLSIRYGDSKEEKLAKAYLRLENTANGLEVTRQALESEITKLKEENEKLEELVHRALFDLQTKGVRDITKIEIDVKLPYQTYTLVKHLLNNYKYEKELTFTPLDLQDLFVDDSFHYRGVKINLINVGYK